MNLEFAVERLYQSGYSTTGETDLETTPAGRLFPSVIAVQRHFSQAGLELAIKHNMMFSCYRATWAPAGEKPDANAPTDDRHGTVVGACEREAAVYALAQLLSHEAATV